MRAPLSHTPAQHTLNRSYRKMGRVTAVPLPLALPRARATRDGNKIRIRPGQFWIRDTSQPHGSPAGSWCVLEGELVDVLVGIASGGGVRIRLLAPPAPGRVMSRIKG